MAPEAQLDEILGLQLAVAWAGEALCEPKRLGWWGTDLIDEAGGGDLLQRLVPRTAVWAGPEAVREAARRADAKARKALASPDGVRTLFFLGFELDEALAERLTVHKRSGEHPKKVLPMPAGALAEWSPSWLEGAVKADPAPKFKKTAAGRQLAAGPPDSPVELCRHLAAALLPVAPEYPCPYFAL